MLIPTLSLCRRRNRGTSSLARARTCISWQSRWEMRSDSQTPPAPPPRGDCHPKGPLASQDKKEATASPLEASDLTEHTDRPAAPSLRQIYLALILKMQLSLTFIAEIKQTRKKKESQCSQLT